jgi:Dyggve-Melchior-Clausen syndrome protein
MQLVQSAVALCFSPDFTVSPEQFEAFLLKITAIREQKKRKEEREKARAMKAANAAKKPKAAPPVISAEAVVVSSAAAAAPGAVVPEDSPAESEGEGQEEEEEEEELEDEQEGEDDDGAATPDEANAVWPMLLWKGGVGFPELVTPQSAQCTQARIDILRLLLAIFCGPLYQDPQPQDPARSRFLDELTSGGCPFAPTLFYSLLNEALSYDPVGYGIPYASSLVTDRAEPLARLCLQSLLVCLDYAPLAPIYVPPQPQSAQQHQPPRPNNTKQLKDAAPASSAAVAKKKPAPIKEETEEGVKAEQEKEEGAAAAASSSAAAAEGEEGKPAEEAEAETAPEEEEQQEEEAAVAAVPEQEVEYGPQFNVFRSLLSGLSDLLDFASLFSGITRLLESLPSASVGSILPGARKGFSSHAEVLVLLWKLLEENSGFLKHVLNDCDVTLLLGPILYVIWTSRKDMARSGEIHLCTFLLLLLSGDRAFGVACNKLCPASKVLPSDCPVIEGTYSDALIVTLHRVVVDGLPKLAPLYTCFLTIICNVSPYVKNLGVVACAKLVHLVELFAAPKFLFARQNNWMFVQQLVESLNNLVQYQYEGSSVLVYTLLRRKHVFERLYSLSPEKWRAEQAAKKRAALAAGGGNGAAVSSSTPRSAAGTGLGEEEGRQEVVVAGDEQEDGASSSSSSSPRRQQAWKPTEEWWRERIRPQLGLGTVLRLVAYLHPLVERFVRMQSGEEAVSAAKGYAPMMLASGAVASLPAGAVPTSALAAAGLVDAPTSEVAPPDGNGSSQQPPKLGYGSVDDSQIVAFIQSTTVVGILPQPHPILTRRYQPNAFTSTWFTTFLWSTIFISHSQDLPLFDSEALRMFAIGVV